MFIRIKPHAVSIMAKVAVVDGLGVTINEKFQAVGGVMMGLMDQANAQSVQSKFGIETVRPCVFYSNDDRAADLVVGSRLHCDDRRYSVKAKAIVQTEIAPTHYELLCEEIDR